MLTMSVLLAFAPDPVRSTLVPSAPFLQEKRMLTVQDLDKLEFLIGRWSGKSPDGSVFYEAYSRPEPTLMRSQRYNDASFSTAVDGSTVALSDGKLISTWGEFSWAAMSVGDGEVSFSPVNAPSSFSWRKIDADKVKVTQNWTDEKGVAQSYELELTRFK